MNRSCFLCSRGKRKASKGYWRKPAPGCEPQGWPAEDEDVWLDQACWAFCRRHPGTNEAERRLAQSLSHGLAVTVVAPPAKAKVRLVETEMPRPHDREDLSELPRRSSRPPKPRASPDDIPLRVAGVQRKAQRKPRKYLPVQRAPRLPVPPYSSEVVITRVRRKKVAMDAPCAAPEGLVEDVEALPPLHFDVEEADPWWPASNGNWTAPPFEGWFGPSVPAPFVWVPSASFPMQPSVFDTWGYY